MNITSILLFYNLPEGPIIAERCPFLKNPLTPSNKHFFFASLTENYIEIIIA